MTNVLSFFRKRKMEKQRKKLLSDIRAGIHLDEDVFSEEQLTKLNSLVEEVKTASPDRMKSLMEKFEEIAGYNTFRHCMRSFLDVVLVALTVAFGIRTLFLQPFQIPTGSMQPTLFGVHYIDRAGAAPFSGPLTKLYHKIFSTEVRVCAGSSQGMFTIEGDLTEEERAGVTRYLDSALLEQQYAPGSVVSDGWVSTGDHLFVDRLSLHFKPLERGEIFIFNTEGIVDPETNHPLPGFFYIKRMVGLPGDTLKIENGILMIRPKNEKKFRPAADFSPRFERLYSGKGGYHGHIAVGLFADGGEFTVPEHAYFAMGDNARNSLDSRYWGAVPRRNVIGRALNVFWPVSRRWGLVDTKSELNVPSGIPDPDRPDCQMPTMRLQ